MSAGQRVIFPGSILGPDMCQVTYSFDPMLCPLLRDLSGEEQQALMRNDPRIAACIEAVNGMAAQDARTTKLVSAYEALWKDAHDKPLAALERALTS